MTNCLKLAPREDAGDGNRDTVRYLRTSHKKAQDDKWVLGTVAPSAEGGASDSNGDESDTSIMAVHIKVEHPVVATSDDDDDGSLNLVLCDFDKPPTGGTLDVLRERVRSAVPVGCSLETNQALTCYDQSTDEKVFVFKCSIRLNADREEGGQSEETAPATIEQAYAKFAKKLVTIGTSGSAEDTSGRESSALSEMLEGFDFIVDDMDEGDGVDNWVQTWSFSVCR